MSNISLYIPGLLDFSRHDLYEDFTEPGSLTCMLARASRCIDQSGHYCDHLAHLFGLDVADDSDFPAAAITRLIDDAGRPEGFWMRADPVHLSADAHGMTLHDVTRLQLEQHEALALGARLQDFFREQRYQLEIPVAERWYVKLPCKAGVMTVPIDEARGESILNRMPQGPEQQKWMMFINEIQMLLHDCDINQIRQASGKLPVNSLWFWGGGELPDILPRRWSRVYSDDVLVRGLCMLSGTDCRPVDQFLQQQNETNGEYLVVLDVAQRCRDYQDIAAWHDVVEFLENQWFQPLLNLVHMNRVRTVNVYTSSNTFHFKRIHLLKFWRAFRHFADLLNAGGNRA